LLVVLVLLGGLAGGCTRESLRIAMAAQQRADEVSQAVFEQQQEALRVLLFRDLVARLAEAGTPIGAAGQAALSAAWNERDLLEFWTVQHERARALRVVGVDAKLASDQAVVDLLLKDVLRRVDRVREGVAAEAGKCVAEEAATSVRQD
jgi:hypothetical protein